MWPVTWGPCSSRGPEAGRLGWEGAEPALTAPHPPPRRSTVDDNPDFDNLDIVARDEEERYFDEEEPEEAPSPELDGD